MTVVVTRDVPGRFRGFLASCMLEIGPGIYTAPVMNAAVRERVWTTLCDWFGTAPDNASVVMTWSDPKQPGGQGIQTLGAPPKQIVEYEGNHLCVGPYSEKHALGRSLTNKADPPESDDLSDVPF